VWIFDDSDLLGRRWTGWWGAEGWIANLQCPKRPNACRRETRGCDKRELHIQALFGIWRGKRNGPSAGTLLFQIQNCHWQNGLEYRPGSLQRISPGTLLEPRCPWKTTRSSCLIFGGSDSEVAMWPQSRGQEGLTVLRSATMVNSLRVRQPRHVNLSAGACTSPCSTCSTATVRLDSLDVEGRPRYAKTTKRTAHFFSSL